MNAGAANAARAPRSRMALALIVAAGSLLVLVQVTLVNLLPTPWAVPDLVAVGVLAIALAHGARVGAMVGAGAGFALDLVPPAAGPLGGWMLVLALAGASMGRVAATYRPGPFAAMAMLAVGSGAVVLARAMVVWFAGAAAGVSWTVLLMAVVASAGWGLLLAPAALLLSVPGARSDPRGRARPAGRGAVGRGAAGLAGAAAAGPHPSDGSHEGSPGPTGTGGRQ